MLLESIEILPSLEEELLFDEDFSIKSIILLLSIILDKFHLEIS